MAIDQITIIMEKTRCTERQAEYLVGEISKYPEVEKLIMSKLDYVDLVDCNRVELQIHTIDKVDLVGYKKDPANSYIIYGKEYIPYVIHQYTFSSLLDCVLYDII